MQTFLGNLLVPAVSLAAGAAIGWAFGFVQQAAQMRNQKKQQEGTLNNGWAVMPGSMRRVAYLLVALALVQFTCPILFNNGCQWWVSGGVVAGYGWMLYKNLRLRMAQNR
jgi:uncharacterized membrane protein